jgi:acetoacetyl-CoA synthetase
MRETNGAPPPEVLWEPTDSSKDGTNILRYMRWLEEYRHLKFQSYEATWQWSVTEIESFWESLWVFFDVRASAPYSRVLSERNMPGVRWFEGARLNYVEQVFRNASPTRPALIYQSELRPLGEISWVELYREVASVAAALRGLGVRSGDRAVALMPNIPETVVAFLACASMGVIWSSCSPDFGGPSIIDRFKQIEPKVLFAVDGYRYNGHDFDTGSIVSELRKSLPTLKKAVIVPYLNEDTDREGATDILWWDDLLSHKVDLVYEQVGLDHALWILYSSGTTGLPKPIVQGHGGILLEHLKSLSLHLDLKPEDKFFWFTTTGWMMWNFVIGGLLVGSTVLLYDGCPSWPDASALWKFAERGGATFLGISPAYISSCMKNGLKPGESHDLSRLRGMGASGSPLGPEGFKWIYESVKQDLWFACISGGTDLCTAFVGGCPLLPVHAGEMQCRCLGAKVEAFDELGSSVVEQLGELVITEPMPSMPLFFWNDEGQKRYKKSYFEVYHGVWRHGDWIKITNRGSVLIYGRSDSTINRFGIRMGTSEMYRTIEEMPEVVDSLVVDLEVLGGTSYMPLFIVLKAGVKLDDELKRKIKEKVRRTLSPRHVPDQIFDIPEVPRTLNGKKMEVPIKKILTGIPIEKAINRDSMSNPESINCFLDFVVMLKRVGVPRKSAHDQCVE